MSDISRLANPGRLLSALVTSFMLATPHVVIAQDDQPAEDIRAIIEGTWELIEWYVDGQILRVPEMDGRWMVHDGMVMATRHRDGVSGYETTAGYGRYNWGGGARALETLKRFKAMPDYDVVVKKVKANIRANIALTKGYLKDL